MKFPISCQLNPLNSRLYVSGFGLTIASLGGSTYRRKATGTPPLSNTCRTEQVMQILSQENPLFTTEAHEGTQSTQRVLYCCDAAALNATIRQMETVAGIQSGNCFTQCPLCILCALCGKNLHDLLALTYVILCCNNAWRRAGARRRHCRARRAADQEPAADDRLQSKLRQAFQRR